MAEPLWHVIINRVTCKSGWKKWASFLSSNSIQHDLHHTHSLEEVKITLSGLLERGQKHFLFCGGDGTVHHGVNLLIKLSGPVSKDITFGVLPCGTGNDWVRTFGTAAHKLARSLKEEYTAPMNVMKVIWPDGRVHYGINMVGGALDASVVRHLKRPPFRIPSFIIYPYGLFMALLRAHTWKGNIRIDNHDKDGKWLTIQAGFGHYCGGGMYVLPHAREDAPGLLLMKPKTLLSILLSTPKIYSGRIIRDKRAHTQHFEVMEITHHDKPIPLEADGEFMGYSPVRIEACFDVMRRIV